MRSRPTNPPENRISAWIDCSCFTALTPSARRVFWVVVILAVLLLGLNIALFESLYSLLRSNALTLRDWILTSILYGLTFLAVFSAISILYNRVQLGAWLFFLGTLAGMAILPFIQEGVAFSAALLVLVVTLLVPLQASGGRHSTAIIALGIATAGAILAADILWTGARAGVAPRNLPIIQAVTVVLGLLLLVSMVTQYSSFNLRSKLLVISLGASLLSIVAVTGAATFYTQTALTDTARAKLLTAARHTADTVDDYLRFNVSIVAAEANLPSLYKIPRPRKHRAARPG